MFSSDIFRECDPFVLCFIHYTLWSLHTQTYSDFEIAKVKHEPELILLTY